MKHWTEYGLDHGALVADVEAGKCVDLTPRQPQDRDTQEMALAWLWPISARAEGYAPRVPKNVEGLGRPTRPINMAIVDILKRHGPLDSLDLRARTGLGKDDLYRDCMRLRRAGLIARAGLAKRKDGPPTIMYRAIEGRAE